MAIHKYEIRDADWQDVKYIASRMRAVDREEVWAMARVRPYRAVENGFVMSEQPRVGTVDDIPVCMFGVVRKSVFTREGSIWMLGTDDIQKHARTFARMNADEIAYLTRDFDYVDNWCDNRNKITMRWLEWLGFNVRKKPQAKGANGELFCYFWKELEDV